MDFCSVWATLPGTGGVNFDESFLHGERLMGAVLQDSRIRAGPIPLEGVTVVDVWVHALNLAFRGCLGLTKAPRKWHQQQQKDQKNRLSHGPRTNGCIMNMMFAS